MGTIKQKVDTNDLEIGMYVSELDRDWLDSPFLIQGFSLDSEKQVEELRTLCDFVYIDIMRGKKPADKPKQFSPAAKEQNDSISINLRSGSAQTSFEEEITEAKKIHQKLGSVVNHLFHSATSDGRLDIKQAQEVVHEVVNSINRNQYALEWMTQLKNKDEYTAIHSMNVCILSVKLAKHIGLSTGELNTIGLCGLMHDIGKLKVPNAILNKPGRLTAAEMKIMRHHAQVGATLLKDSKEVPGEVHGTALSHHEKMDGTGYPNKLGMDDIKLCTRIVSVADIYDAVTSDRIYHNGISANDAASLLYRLREHHLDKELVESFIQCVGIYPVGSIVETKAGEVGLVVSASERHRINPYVLMVLNKAKERVSKPYIVNTAKLKDEDGNLKYEIKQSLDANSYDISPKDFFD